MQVKVKLDPIFCSAVGGNATVLLQLRESATVADGIAALIEKWPALEELLHSPSALYTMFVNSRIVPQRKADAAALKDGDTLYLLQPVAGG